jgi:hypothetical protein
VSFNDTIRPRKIAERFFDSFRKLFPELLFHSMGESEPLENRFDSLRAPAEWEAVWDYIFHGKKPASFYVLPHWLRLESHSRWVESIAVILDEQFWSKNKIPDLWERAIRLLKDIANLGSPIYGKAFTWSEFEEKGFLKRTLPNGLVSTESVNLTPREGLTDLFGPIISESPTLTFLDWSL